MNKTHEKWMMYCLKEAEQALKEKEIPVGAIVVYDNKIIGKGHNQIELLQDSTAHAEILALREASRVSAETKLVNCDLYVTLEP